ncbi:MAG: hypothetical protein Q9191_002992 [Dirinaria sp. TL-2023a]
MPKNRVSKAGTVSEMETYSARIGYASSRPSELAMFQRRAQIDVEAGELWLSAKKDQDPWPVVICDEDMLQILARGKRPANARQKNGDWRNEFCPGGDLADQRCFPTMRLGTMQLCWTPWKRLAPLDIQQARNIRDRTDDLRLANACTEAIEHYGRNDVRYWKERLLTRQLSVSNSRENLHIQHEETVLSKKRRVGQDGFTFRLNSLQGDLNTLADDDSFDGFDDDKRAHGAKSIKIKHESPELRGEDSTLTKEMPASDRAQQRDRAVQTGELSTSASSSSSRTLLEGPLPSRSTYDVLVTDPTYSSSSLKIYVGSPHKVFTVSDTGVVLFSDHFEENVSVAADSTLYVMSPLLLSISPNDFEPIAAYLRSEIFPDDSGRRVVLDLEQRTEATMLMELKRCAMTYHIAKKLGFGNFTHAVKRMLESLTVSPTKEFMDTVRYLLQNGAMEDTTVAAKARSCLVEHFWELMEIDGAMLSELMASSPSLREKVLKELLQVTRKQSKDEASNLEIDTANDETSTSDHRH